MHNPPAADGDAVFGPILSAIGRAPSVVLQAQMDAYVRLLMAHDWTYEYSDDGRVHRQGRAERDTLNLLQRELDPQGAVWNQHAPAEFAIKVAEFTPATDAQPWGLPA